MQALFIDARRDAYSPDGLQTMTVEELIDYLSQFDGETPVVLSHDGGYTYGAIRYDSFTEASSDEI